MCVLTLMITGAGHKRRLRINVRHRNRVAKVPGFDGDKAA